MDYYDDGDFGGFEDYVDNMDPEAMAEFYRQMQAMKRGQEVKHVSWSEITNQCIIPIVREESSSTNLIFLIAACLLLRLTSQLRFLPPIVAHSTSCLFGLYALYRYHGHTSTLVLLLLLTISFGLMRFLCATQLKRRIGIITALFCLAVCTAFEWFVLLPKDFNQMRGSLMVLAMKTISIAFDVGNGSVEPPSLHAYLGYNFCVASIIFGPWIAFKDYVTMFENREIKSHVSSVLRSALYLAFSAVCLVYATCVSSWVFPDDYAYTKWQFLPDWAGPHYFVSFLSHALVLLSGVIFFESGKEKLEDTDSPDGERKETEFFVTAPLSMETPRSLVRIVTDWNYPVHRWLKIYVFQPLKYRGTLTTVIITYAASSLLHGFNFTLGAVLLSLSFYTYAEYVMRAKIAKAYDACVGSKPCREGCGHSRSWRHPLALLLNVVFGLLAAFHLAYLSMVFSGDIAVQEAGYSAKHTMGVWSSWNYNSHIVGFATFLVAISI